MTEPDDSPRYSPLCQSMTRDGKTVQVDIYGDGKGGWLPEVIDEYGNSSVWDDPFATDQGALDEVLKTVSEEGIDSLIGSPSERLPMTGLNQSLSEAELVELDEFLGSEANEDTAMDVSTLEGFLTAIVMGPRMVPPSEWLPWVWDLEEGKAEADFESEAQASQIMSLILRLYNSMNTTFNTDPASFEPIFWRAIQWGAAEWSEGFITGFMFNEEAWSLLSIWQPTWFTPFFRLGTDEGIDLTKSGGDAERWINEIEPSLVRIHAYWKEKRVNQPAALLSADYHHRGGQKEFPQVVRGGSRQRTTARKGRLSLVLESGRGVKQDFAGPPRLRPQPLERLPLQQRRQTGREEMKLRLSPAGGACGAVILHAVRAKFAHGEIVSAARTQTEQICPPRSKKFAANRIVAAARRQFATWEMTA